MLTQAQSQDVLNTVESNIVTALQADAWFGTGGTGAIQSVVQHTLEIDQKDQMWWDATLPALVVGAAAVREVPERGTFGAYWIVVPCSIEYLRVDGKMDSAIGTIQTVTTRLLRWLHDEEYTAAKQFNGFLATANGTLLNAEAVEIDYEEAGEDNASFLFSAGVNFGVLCRVAA